jgi:hypothetical protein
MVTLEPKDFPDPTALQALKQFNAMIQDATPKFVQARCTCTTNTVQLFASKHGKICSIISAMTEKQIQLEARSQGRGSDISCGMYGYNNITSNLTDCTARS